MVKIAKQVYSGSLQTTDIKPCRSRIEGTFIGRYFSEPLFNLSIGCKERLLKNVLSRPSLIDDSSAWKVQPALPDVRIFHERRVANRR